MNLAFALLVYFLYVTTVNTFEKKYSLPVLKISSYLKWLLVIDIPPAKSNFDFMKNWAATQAKT